MDSRDLERPDPPENPKLPRIASIGIGIGSSRASTWPVRPSSENLESPWGPETSRAPGPRDPENPESPRISGVSRIPRPQAFRTTPEPREPLESRDLESPEVSDGYNDGDAGTLTVGPAKSMVIEGARRGLCPQGSGSGLQGARDKPGHARQADKWTAAKECGFWQ